MVVFSLSVPFFYNLTDPFFLFPFWSLSLLSSLMELKLPSIGLNWMETLKWCSDSAVPGQSQETIKKRKKKKELRNSQSPFVTLQQAALATKNSFKPSQLSKKKKTQSEVMRTSA